MKKNYLNGIAGLAIVVSALVGCNSAPPKTDNSVVVEPAPAQGNTETESSNGSTASSNEKIAKDIITTTVDLTKTVIKTLKVNDSIRIANREQMYAYQIGLPVKGKDEVFEEYAKLEDKESVYVLEKSRKEYYILKYEGKSQDELNASLDDYKTQIPSGLSGGVKIINVMNLCSKRKTLMKGENLTKRKENTEIPCLICN